MDVSSGANASRGFKSRPSACTLEHGRGRKRSKSTNSRQRDDSSCSSRKVKQKSLPPKSDPSSSSGGRCKRSADSGGRDSSELPVVEASHEGQLREARGGIPHGAARDNESCRSGWSQSPARGSGSEVGSWEGSKSSGARKRDMVRRDGTEEVMAGARGRILEALGGIMEELQDDEVEHESDVAGVLRLLCNRLQLSRTEDESMAYFFLQRTGWINTPDRTQAGIGKAAGEGGVSGLATACATVAAIVTPFAYGVAAKLGGGGGFVEDPIAGAAYAMVVTDNPGNYKEKIDEHFGRRFGPCLRTAKSRVGIAHRKAYARLFQEVFESFQASEEAKSDSLMRVVEGSLRARMATVSTGRWMEIGREGLSSVISQHQKALKASGDTRILTLLDLIRHDEGANTEESYTGKVLVKVATDAVVEPFASWVSSSSRQGIVPTLTSLVDLKKMFITELESTEQGQGVKEEGMGRGGGRKRGSVGREPWSVERAGKELRSNFTESLFKAMFHAFGGAGGIAALELGKDSLLRDLHAVYRPYLLDSEEGADDGEMKSSTEPEGGDETSNKGGDGASSNNGDDGSVSDGSDESEGGHEDDGEDPAGGPAVAG